MREKAIWAALHKIWEKKSNGRILRYLLQQTSGTALWEMKTVERRRCFSQVPEEFWELLDAQQQQIDLSKVEAYLQQNQIQMLLYKEAHYPAILKEIHQPPAILYWKGSFQPAKLNIAIVGSRKADYYGLEIAEQIGIQLSQEHVCVISGLARGIDSKAHQGALQGVGGTIAVQGCGIDQIYPRENRKLAQQILAHENGCILSEFPLGSPPLAWHFPQRNRVISGLAQGVVIVQAALKSGAFITVETALEQGRDVFAVPGQIHNPLSAGPHRFLQEGAKLITCGADILEEYGQSCLWETRQAEETAVQLTKEEETVLQYFSAEPITIEEVAYLSKLSIAELMPILSMLELYGLIQQMIGRKYIRVG